MTSISVVIAAYNHLEEVLQCLCSLQNTASRTIPIEFIVADDASPAVFFPALISSCSAKVVRRPENGGYAANVNTGAAFAEGDIILLLNQDVFAVSADLNENPFSINWDIALVNAFERENVGVVGAKLIFPDGKIQSAGGEFDAHCQPYHRCLGYSDHTYSEVNTPQTVEWVTGAALAIRRELFNQVGGYDTGYVGGYFEDVDLCLRVQLQGATIWYEPRLQFVHKVGTSGGNPHFMQNARRFKSLWVDTGKIKPTTYMLKGNWW